MTKKAMPTVVSFGITEGGHDADFDFGFVAQGHGVSRVVVRRRKKESDSLRVSRDTQEKFPIG